MADDEFSFDLDDVSIENYVYSCEEPQHIEHCECFSFSESVEVRSNRTAFQKSISSPWSRLSDSDKSDHIQAWLQSLETTSDALRGESLSALVHVVQGVPHEAESHDDVKSGCKANCILLKENGILHVITTVLPFLVDAVDSLTAQFDEQFAAAEVKGSPPISEEVLVNSDYWVKFKQLRHSLSILYCCLLWNSDDAGFVRDCLAFNTGGKPLIVYLFDLLAADRWAYYPLKKVVCIIRLQLLLSFGPISTNHLILNHDPNDKSSNSYTHRPPKARAHHLMDTVEKFSQSFTPIYLKKDESGSDRLQFDSFAPLPIAVKESLSLLSSHMYIPKALHASADETPEESTVSISEAPTDELSEVKEEKEAEGEADGEAAFNSPAKQLYSWLVHRLDQYVTRMLQLLIAAEPSTGHVQGVPDIRLELLVSPSIPDVYALDLGRHRELILKSLSFILLKLLKTFKQHDYGAKEFQYLCTLLQQRNCIPLLLKWLNKKKLFDSCLMNSEVPELGVLNPTHADVEMSNGLSNIDEAKQVSEVSTRKCAAYIHLLRILVKITKHSPLHLYAQVVLKSHDICKMLWKNMYQPDFQLYILKNFKNMMKYIAPRWKETSMNMKIVSAVFHTVRLDLIDNWMDQAELSRAQHMGLIQRLQDQREALGFYNAKNYGVKVETLRIRPSLFMPTLSEDEASHMVHVEAATAQHNMQLDETSLAFYDVLLAKELSNVNNRFFSLNGFAFLRALNVDKALDEILPEDTK